MVNSQFWDCAVIALGGHIAALTTNGASWPPKSATRNANIMPKSPSDQRDGTHYLGLVAVPYAAGLDRVRRVWVWAWPPRGLTTTVRYASEAAASSPDQGRPEHALSGHRSAPESHDRRGEKRTFNERERAGLPRVGGAGPFKSHGTRPGQWERLGAMREAEEREVFRGRVRHLRSADQRQQAPDSGRSPGTTWQAGHAEYWKSLAVCVGPSGVVF